MLLRWNRLKHRLSALVPVLLVVGTFGLAFAVHGRIEGTGSLVGFAQGVPEAAAALEPARVTAVHVAVGAEVEAGQLLASLDTSVLDSEIAIAQAEKVRLETSIRLEQTNLGRRLDVDRDTVEREATREREELRRLNAEAQALEREIERVSKLVAEHQAVASDLAQLKVRRAQLDSVATEKPKTIGVLTRQLAAASQRRDAVDDDVRTSARLDAELLVVQRRIELLEKRRSSHLLRATRKGRVSSIDKQPGEIARAGDAIVTLVSTTNQVSVCVPEDRSVTLRKGGSARLWVRGRRGAPLAGRTIALGPRVAELPSRCWPSPTARRWGREVIVAIDDATDIVAGQAFSVALDAAPAPPLAHSAGIPVAKAGGVTHENAATDGDATRFEPRVMTVPPSLARRTRFEPSGILGQPNEGRYLLVSDDTGIKDDASEGRPWLFAMNTAGAVAPEPIVIDGAASIDDLESITAGDAGEIYVLSSQSYSRKGHRKRARTALLRLRPDGGHYRVDGSVHLAEMLEAAPARAAALGLASGLRDLDIEGMTFHGGALYLGLKAPLDANGDAMIWKIPSPKALFVAPSSGTSTLEASGIALWAHARVDVELDGKIAAGGISELLFVDPDSLVLTSTPSKEERAAGALWRVDHVSSGGALSPRLVRRFPGWKPEGLSPSLSGANLLVVFDTGNSTPYFLETPWPP